MSTEPTFLADPDEPIGYVLVGDHDEDDGGPELLAELHRRIADTTENLRAADSKASTVLGLVGVAGGLAAAHVPTAVAPVVAAAWLVPVVLLLMTITPRTARRRRFAAEDPYQTLALVRGAALPDALAAELGDLDRIASRKYRLIRAALMCLPIALAAYLCAQFAR